MTFGEWLRIKRKAAGLSQERLAELASAYGASVTGAYISNIERGYDTNRNGRPIRPSESIVEALARVLNVSIDEARLQANYAPASESFQFTGVLAGIEDLDPETQAIVSQQIRGLIAAFKTQSRVQKVGVLKEKAK